jgi:hypothetical protein
MRTERLRLVANAALGPLAFGLAAALGACTSSSPSAGTTDGSTDAGSPDDASTDVPSADAKVGTACALNRECGRTERCECDEAAGTCTCKTGARGAGKNGVDACTDGNGCASALCVEGQRNKFYCSDECSKSTDCGPELPLCADIALVGRICIRDPDGG